jgi:type IV fimbrial biogenesis protein FimT
MKNRISGFTLIELMVTVAVLAILVTIALPNYRAFVLNSRMTAQANDFLAALNLARSEAIKRNAPVTMSAKGGDWADGWVIWATADGDGNPIPLRDHPALEGASSVVGDAAITFQSNGQAGATTFNLCNPDTATAPGRDIEVEVSGRASVVKPGTCP